MMYARPINQNYLEYSARDVKDLIEVRHNMIEKLHKIGNRLKIKEGILDNWGSMVSL